MTRLLAILLALCLVLCGCNSADKPYVPTGDGLTYDDDYTGPQKKPTTEQEPQVLNLAYYKDVTMNPYQCTDFTNRALFSLLYQSLFTVDRDYVIQPQLCKSYTVSEDMTSYTFYLERATFSDGSVLTVDDVVASLHAAKDSKYYGGRFLHITGIEKTADSGVQIQLDIPYENFPLLLDIPIIKASQTALARPLGTGPYKIVTTAGGESLQKLTNWWCQKDMAVTAEVISLFEANSATHIRDQFEFFDLSMVCADPGSDRYADYRCDYELWDCENGIFLYLATSESSKVFSNDTVRTALTYAVDRNMLVEKYYRGFARSASLPASPQFPHYSLSLAERYAFDKAKFADAVKSAGMIDEKIIFLVNSDDSLRLRVARAIADMLREGGLQVELQALGTNEYKDALVKWNYDIYLGQTKLSPTMDLSAFFSPYGELSWGGVNDVTAYSLGLQALENHGNYYTLHKTIMDNGLICPVLFRSYAIYAVRGLVTDLTPSRDNVFYYSMDRYLDDCKTVLSNPVASED